MNLNRVFCIIFLFATYSGLTVEGGGLSFDEDGLCTEFCSCGAEIADDSCQNQTKCPDNCSCDKGGCVMSQCTNMCTCKGGNCDMPSCRGNCFCGNPFSGIPGNCTGPAFEKQTTTSGTQEVKLGFVSGLMITALVVGLYSF